MQTLIDAGILDLGGNGDIVLEIEYKNNEGKFREAFYRLPTGYDNVDTALMIHDLTHTDIVLVFPEQVKIALPDRCEELIAVRLPGAIGGDDITMRFVSG